MAVMAVLLMRHKMKIKESLSCISAMIKQKWQLWFFLQGIVTNMFLHSEMDEERDGNQWARENSSQCVKKYLGGKLLLEKGFQLNCRNSIVSKRWSFNPTNIPGFKSILAGSEFWTLYPPSPRFHLLCHLKCIFGERWIRKTLPKARRTVDKDISLKEKNDVGKWNFPLVYPNSHYG